VEAPCSPEYEKNILESPPDQVHWFDLEYLTRKDPELAAQRWEKMKVEASDELKSGHRAAHVMEGYSSQPWMRAQFLAVRRDLLEAWHPRNGLERQLIDMMAQAQTAILFWQERLTVRASFEPHYEKRDIKEYGGYSPPRVSDVEAEDQAAAMVERFNKMFLRTLRSLQSIRRSAVPVIVRSAGQVNVGMQQLNLLSPGASGSMQ
jgi:hypothetical protein